MGVIARPALAGLPAWRPILIGVLLVLAAVAGALIYVGSRPTPLPPPFGPAGNGNLYFADAKGDIYAMDPTTFTPTAIVSGGNQYGGPLPSKDGRLIEFFGDRDRKENSDIHYVWLRAHDEEKSARDRTLDKAQRLAGNPSAGGRGGAAGRWSHDRPIADRLGSAAAPTAAPDPA